MNVAHSKLSLNIFVQWYDVYFPKIHNTHHISRTQSLISNSVMSTIVLKYYSTKGSHPLSNWMFFYTLCKEGGGSTLMVSLTVKYMFSLLITSIIGFSTFLYLSVHIWHLIKGAGENLMKLKQPDGSLLGNEGIIEDHFCIVVIERTNLKPFKWFIIHWRKSEKM